MADPGTTENIAPVTPEPTTPPASSGSTTALAAVEKAFAAHETDSSSASPATSGAAASAVHTPAAAITPTPVADPSTSAVPPVDRWPTILANARREAAADAAKDFEHVKGLDRAFVEQAIANQRRLMTDAREFYKALGSELNPETDQIPEPGLVSEDGKHQAYSAEQVQRIRDIDRRTLKAELLAELRPTMEFAQTSQAQAREAAERAAGAQAGEAFYQELSALPHFTANQAAIAEKLQAMDPQVLQRMGVMAATYQAYTAVLNEKVWPTITPNAETAVLTDLQRKAHSSTGTVRPGSTGASQTRKLPRNEQELAKHLEMLSRQSA